MGRRSILAVDYGRARMGLAIADSETRMAQPLSTMERVNRNGTCDGCVNWCGSKA